MTNFGSVNVGTNNSAIGLCLIISLNRELGVRAHERAQLVTQCDTVSKSEDLDFHLNDPFYNIEYYMSVNCSL